MKLTPIGVDLAKSVFQVHGVDEQTGEEISKTLKRSAFLGRYVKAFNVGNKSDAADARAIWRAVQMPGRTVSVKGEEPESILALHRMRQQWVKMRTMKVNELRGLLAEFGEVMGRQRAALDKGVPKALERLSARLCAGVIGHLRDQHAELSRFDAKIKGVEASLKAWFKRNKACQMVAQIPGVGLLTATAAVAMLGDGRGFASGREFSAYVGLVPRQVGSGGHVKLLGISKRGDRYLRTLLIHGARSVRAHAKRVSAWVEQLASRTPSNVVTVALANKLARTLWAVVAHGRAYDPAYAGQPA